MTRPSTTQAEQPAAPEVEAPTQAAPLKPGNAYDGETEADKTARQEAIRQAYSQASTWLREENLTAFNNKVRELAATAGYDWKPKPSKADKARAALKALLEEHPELAEEIQQQQA